MDMSAFKIRLGLGYERQIVKSPVYRNLLPLRMLRWSDTSVKGVLAGYHDVYGIFPCSVCRRYHSARVH